MGIDPVTLSLIISSGSAAAGAIGNALSKDPADLNLPPKPVDYTIADMEKYGYKPIDAARRISQLSSLLTDQKNKTLQNTAALKFSQGKTVGNNDVWANTATLADSLLNGTMKIQDLSEEQKNQIAEYLFRINSSRQDQYQRDLWNTENTNKQIDASKQSWWEKALEGGIEGFGVGTKLANTSLFTKALNGNDGTKASGATSAVTPLNITAPVKQPVLFNEQDKTNPEGIMYDPNIIKNPFDTTGSQNNVPKTVSMLNSSENGLDKLPTFDELMSRYNPDWYQTKNLFS